MHLYIPVILVHQTLKDVKGNETIRSECREDRVTFTMHKCCSAHTSTPNVSPPLVSLVGFVIATQLIQPNKILSGYVSVDMHPISLYAKTQLISHFTNSSEISTYQIPYRQQIRTCPNELIVFPS